MCMQLPELLRSIRRSACELACLQRAAMHDAPRCRGCMHACMQVGATIREKIVPRAVAWYTGEAIEDEGGFEFYPGDDDDDEDE